MSMRDNSFYGPTLTGPTIPVVSYDNNGNELWSYKLSSTSVFAESAWPKNTSAFCANSGNFVFGGSLTTGSNSDNSLTAYLLEINKDGTENKIVTFGLEDYPQYGNNLQLQSANWVKDDSENYYMYAKIASNEFVIMKFAGPVSNMQFEILSGGLFIRPALLWCKRYKMIGEMANFNIVEFKSMMFNQVKNQIWISVRMTNIKWSVGVLNQGGYMLVGFDATDGRIVKYGVDYSGRATYGTTADITYDLLDGIITDYDSAGDIMGTETVYTNNYGTSEYYIVTKFNNQTAGSATDQYDIQGYRVQSEIPGYGMMNMPFYTNQNWVSGNSAKVLFNIDEVHTSPYTFWFQGYPYSNQNARGTCLSIVSHRLVPERSEDPVTNGRVLGFAGFLHMTNNQAATGLYSWYLKNNEFSDTTTYMDLYNYRSAAQQKTNKRRIGAAISTRTMSGTVDSVFHTILPAFSEIDYGIATHFYQRKGEEPRWPDRIPRPNDSVYGKATYGIESRYIFSTNSYLYTQPYKFSVWSETNVDLTKVKFGGHNTVSFYPTNQGNIITKTSFYPDTTYGFSNPQTTQFFTMTTNQVEISLASWAYAQGWNGISPLHVTINPGVYIYAETAWTRTALSIGGPFPNGVTLVNNGFIMGLGGGGGLQFASQGGQNTPGGNGGRAIYLSVDITIDNRNGYIGGGGGGGASLLHNSGFASGGGGGQGGGPGGAGYNNNLGVVYGGEGGAPGSAGSNGTILGSAASGGGGGRVFPGVGAAGRTYSGVLAGLGGTGGGSGAVGSGGTSGAGGAAGVNGGSQTPNFKTGYHPGGGGGGGFGAAGGGSSAAAGGAGGNAITLAAGRNPIITWVGGFPSNRVFGSIAVDQ
jgi:hypothetical protein